MGNLDLYNRVKQPPNDALKEFDNGKFKGTDINPMWRILKLTEEFGVSISLSVRGRSRVAS